MGYSNANYALSEVRDPVRTIKRTAPLAMLLITLIYMLVNIAYYAVVDKEEILGSGRIAAALFFGKLWGLKTERVKLPLAWQSIRGSLFSNAVFMQVLSTVVAMSALRHVLAVLFPQGRGP